MKNTIFNLIDEKYEWFYHEVKELKDFGIHIRSSDVGRAR